MLRTRIKQLLSFKGIIITVDLLLFVLIAAVAVWLLTSNAERREVAARVHMWTFLKAMDVHVHNTYKEADVALQGFANAYRAAPASTRASSEAIRAMLIAQRGSDDSETWLVFFNVRGEGVASTNLLSFVPQGYADRDYFQVHFKANPPAGSYVGAPARGKTSGRRFLPISRRIFDDKGQLAGIAVYIIDAASFANVFAKARFSEQDVISLSHRSGKVVARVPDFEQTFGLDIADADFFRDYLAGKKSGLFDAVSRVDNERRISAFQEVEGLPLVLSTGLPYSVLANGLLEDVLMAASVLLLIGAILLVTGKAILGAHAGLERSEARFRQLYTAIRDGVAYIDMQGRLVDVNEEFVKLSGYSREELIGRPLRSLIPEKWHAQEQQIIDEQVLPRGFSEDFDKEYVRKDGSIIAVNAKIWLMRDEREAPSMMAVAVRDVTRRRALAEKVAYLAQHDVLTGLVNRATLADRVEHALRQARRRNEFVALIFIDLDGFKLINDTYGHAAGDLMLKGVAAVLTGSLRASDTACRFGGDEFIVVLPDLADPLEAQTVIGKIERAAAEGIEWEGQRLPIRFSHGLAVYPRDGEDGEALLQHADSAMYRAKAAHRSSTTQ